MDTHLQLRRLLKNTLDDILKRILKEFDYRETYKFPPKSYSIYKTALF